MYYGCVSSEQTVNVLKALADPTRIELVRQLAHCPTEQKSCGELSEHASLSQPALSHHFGKLVAAGVVIERKNGTQKDYKLNDELLARLGIDPTKL